MAQAYGTFILLFSFLTIWDFLPLNAKVFIVLMDEEPVTSLKFERSNDRFVEFARIMLVFLFFFFPFLCGPFFCMRSDVISFLTSGK